MKRAIFATIVLLFASTAWGAAPTSPRHGTTEFTGTIYSDRIVATAGTAGPTAMVSFVWDDGNDNNYDLLFPMMGTQGEVGNLAIVTDYVGGGGKLTWTEISAMADSGWEVVSHSVSHPVFNDTLSDSDLTDELVDSLATFTAQGLDVESFAYPGGGNTYRIRTETAKYYRSGRGIGGEGYNYELLRTYGLASFIIDDDSLGSTYEGYVDVAETNKTWLIFYGHGTDSDDVTMLSTLVDYIQAKSIPIVTFSDALDILENRIQIGDLGTGGNKADSSEPSGFAVGPWGDVKAESIMFSRGTTEMKIGTNTSTEITIVADDGDQIVTLTQAGLLGLGHLSTTPGVELDVWGALSLGRTAGGNGVLKSYFDRDTPTTNFGRFYHSGAGTGLRIEASSSVATMGGGISLWTTPGDDTPVQRLTIDEHGKVGITDTDPTAQFEVESATDVVTIVARVDAGQTANAVEVQAAAGTVMFAIDDDGSITGGTYNGATIAPPSYGAIYATDMSLTITTTDLHYLASGGTGSGVGEWVQEAVNGVSYNGTTGSFEIDASSAGVYEMEWAMTVEGGNNSMYDCHISVEGSDINMGHAHVEMAPTAVNTPFNGIAIDTLVADDSVTLQCSDKSSTADLLIIHGEFIINRISP